MPEDDRGEKVAESPRDSLSTTRVGGDEAKAPDDSSPSTPATEAPSADESVREDCCAICFEFRAPVTLPCACHVSYCRACWDRALAVSVSRNGHAQCPSCRAHFNVDYDPKTEDLVFSKETNQSETCDWRGRLYDKAKPVQIEKLRRFGDELSQFGKVVALHTPTEEERPYSSEGGGTPTPFPDCVCGSQLECVSSKERLERMLDDTDPRWRSNAQEATRIMQRLESISVITCDICDELATRSGAVWTCRNGPHTMAHPASYDVCERCFTEYAGFSRKSKGGTVVVVQSGETCDELGCCRTCAGAISRSVSSSGRSALGGIASAVAPPSRSPTRMFKSALAMIGLSSLSRDRIV